MRQKTSERMKNRVLSEEQKNRLRKARLGSNASEETKLKMSNSHKLAWAKRKMNNND